MGSIDSGNFFVVWIVVRKVATGVVSVTRVDGGGMFIPREIAPRREWCVDLFAFVRQLDSNGLTSLSTWSILTKVSGEGRGGFVFYYSKVLASARYS